MNPTRRDSPQPGPRRSVLRTLSSRCQVCTEYASQDDLYAVLSLLVCRPCWAVAVTQYAEAYPDLKANQNMAQLMEELTSTENKIGFSRQAFNDSVTTYNTACQVFPAVLFAGMFGFAQADLFEVEEPTQREAPKVSFS